jgi:hypothetical protein
MNETAFDAQLAEAVVNINHNEIQQQLIGIKTIRLLLSLENQLPKTIASDAVPRLVSFLMSTSPELQYEAACVLTQHRHSRLGGGGSTRRSRRCDRRTRECANKRLWSFGCIAGNCEQMCALVLTSSEALVCTELIVHRADAATLKLLHATVTEHCLVDCCVAHCESVEASGRDEAFASLGYALFLLGRHRMAESCIAMQTLDLRALVSVTIALRAASRSMRRGIATSPFSTWTAL